MKRSPYLARYASATRKAAKHSARYTERQQREAQQMAGGITIVARQAPSKTTKGQS